MNRLGLGLFAAALAGLGIETLVCARVVSHGLGPEYRVLPVIPWLPAIPLIGWIFGALWLVCGLCLWPGRTRRAAALVLSMFLFVCTLVLEVPKNAAHSANISLRTAVLEPLAIACLACLLPGASYGLERASRYLLALSLMVFGVDHFLALQFIAVLLPGWIPWHVFWVGFFGAALIAAGLGIALEVLHRAVSVCLGLMFGIWVVTLHLPRVIGLYGIPGAPRNPDEWSSLLIAMALWGGFWAVAQAAPVRRV